MPSDDPDWFVNERSKALASLLLTSRDDVAVESERSRDDGVDLLVSLKSGDEAPSKVFSVQVKGSLSSDRRAWAKSVKHLFRKSGHFIPACLFVFNVRDKEAAYAWLAEPEVEGTTAKLGFFKQPDFHALDEGAVGHVVAEVDAWYEAMPHTLVSRNREA